MERPADRVKRQIIGCSPVLHDSLRKIELAAGHPRASVVIQGETGTGKELAARLFHAVSRPNGPFMAINCSTQNKDLIGSELFGHVKGAFTGAVRDKKGAFEQAHQGVLFLDEIGDLPLELQAQLLRVLQEGEVRRVGGEQTINVDVRIVAATNRDLRAMVKEGTFREDLYYRLAGCVVTLPPLRERGRDVVELAQYFLDKESLNKRLTAKAKRNLMTQAWPGNIRDLENLVCRLSIYVTGRMIDVQHIRDCFDGDHWQNCIFDKESRGERIMTLLDEVDSISPAKVQEMFAVSAATARRDLGALLQSGLVRRFGKGNRTQYALPDKGRSPEEHLLDFMKRVKKATPAQLRLLIDVSSPTIRRYLVKMEQEGHIRRIYRGRSSFCVLKGS
ncbi:MAG: DeoR family transcriptional regulator, partial [Deltaproteobacteria bacterium]|nr:DeoR family transcriptional regulator [Deltaproteobacteria bacterium]